MKRFCSMVLLVLVLLHSLQSGDAVRKNQKEIKPINCRKYVYAKQCRGATKRDVEFRLMPQNQEYDDRFFDYETESNDNKIFVSTLLDRIIQQFKNSRYESEDNMK